MAEEQQVSVVVTTTLDERGRTYHPGSTITVSESKAQELIAAGAARLPEDEPSDAELQARGIAPPPPPEPEPEHHHRKKKG